MPATETAYLQIDQRQGALEAAMIEAAMFADGLASLAWSDGDDRPTWSPDPAWLAEMEAYSRGLAVAFSELRAAADSA